MKKILLLDDNKELCMLMTTMFKELGNHEIRCFHSYADVTALKPQELNFDIAFLDVNLGVNVPTGIDVFDWIMKNGYKGRVVFFTGHARSYPLLKKSMEYPNIQLLEKPADIDQIQAHLKF